MGSCYRLSLLLVFEECCRGVDLVADVLGPS